MITMKRILLLSLVFLSVGVYAQQGTDMRVGLADLSDVSGKGMSSSGVVTGSEMVLRIPVMNMSQTGIIPAGSCRLEIDLGQGLEVGKGFSLSNVGMSDYFEWTRKLSADGNLVIVGTVKSGIPGDFMGSAQLHLQSTRPGLNLINMKWIYNNPKLNPLSAKTSSSFQIRTVAAKGTLK